MSAHDYLADELMTTAPSERFFVQQAILNASDAEWRDSWRVQLYFASCQGEFIPGWLHQNILREYRTLKGIYHGK